MHEFYWILNVQVLNSQSMWKPVIAVEMALDKNLRRCRLRGRSVSRWGPSDCRFQDVDRRRQTGRTWSRRDAAGSVGSTPSPASADRCRRSAFGPDPAVPQAPAFACYTCSK